jgi:hypothetical protein
LAERQSGNDEDIQDGYEHQNIFSRQAKMGNQTISSYEGDKISDITESIKIMNDSMELKSMSIPGAKKMLVIHSQIRS